MNKLKIIRTKTGWRWLTTLSLSLCLLTGIVVSEGAKAQSNNRQRRSTDDSLSKYATDLTAAAEQGRFNSIDERTKDTDRAIEILAGHHRNNPVVISDSQAIRDTVVIGVALRIAHGDVPEELMATRLYKLNLETLFHDAKTADDLTLKVSAILAGVTGTDSKAILIIDPIQSLVGSKSAFDGAVSNLFRDAIQNSQVQCFGASTEAAFEQNVGSDESLAPLFSTVETTEVETATSESNDSTTQSVSREEFAGDNVSPDLREMIASGNAPARVKAILQVNDPNSATLRQQLSQYGVNIEAQLPRFGALAVDMPTTAIEKLSSNGGTNYLSLDRSVGGLGHVEETTGDEAMLSQPGNAALDGSSIGVAVLDSGISSKQKSVNARVVYSKDFTGEGTTEDSYGHGTFVASMIVAKHGSYGGIAPGANLLNLRVLDS